MLLRIGASSAPVQQQQQQHSGKKRTRDDAVSSGSTQQMGVPRFSMTVSTPGQTQQSQIVCHRCGKKGHTKKHYRSQPRPATQSAPRITTCYRCGQPGHVQRDCPQTQLRRQGVGSRAGGSTVPVQAQQSYRPPAAPAPSGMTSQAFGSGPIPPRGGKQQGLPQGRVYAATTAATPPDSSVVRGTFLVFSSWASVLIDTRASPSFISASFASALGLEISTLDSPL